MTPVDMSRQLRNEEAGEHSEDAGDRNCLTGLPFGDAEVCRDRGQ